MPLLGPRSIKLKKDSQSGVAFRFVDTKADDYRTLGPKRQDLDYVMLTISYMHNFDWKLRPVR